MLGRIDSDFETKDTLEGEVSWIRFAVPQVVLKNAPDDDDSKSMLQVEFVAHRSR
jgi:hypothetical protein